MKAPECAQCGTAGWEITVNGAAAAPLTLEWIHSTYAETLYFCDTLCLLRWAVEQREGVVQSWHNAWSKSAGDVNHILRAPLIDRILIGRWWGKRVDRRTS